MKQNFLDLIILYVEDDEIIRKQAVKYLEKLCKKVLSAQDGIEALEMYEYYKPDIIISDIKMPRFNGLEMAKRIRKSNKRIPIIIATAFIDTKYLLEAVELQLIKYLVKPISSVKLLEALNLAYEHLHQDDINIININPSTIYDTFNKTLIINNKLIKLTKNELLLLDLLVKSLQNTVSYEKIEHTIWFNKDMSIDTLRSLVRLLRNKLPNIDIENVSGMGYKLKT